MKKYKIIVGGKGAECYIHRVNSEKKSILTEGKVEDDKMDFQEIGEVLGVDDALETDDIFLGPYNNPELYFITVVDENEKTIWESKPKHEFEDYQWEYKFDDDQVLVLEDYSKGIFYEYELELEKDFNSQLLIPIVTEIAERVEIITGFIYDEIDLSSYKEYGDYWSKGITYHLT
jgi:hypothetical protein